jgi:hypothetical protein
MTDPTNLLVDLLNLKKKYEQIIDIKHLYII